MIEHWAMLELTDSVKRLLQETAECLKGHDRHLFNVQRGIPQINR